jgi:hypothetical protein
MQKPNQGFDVLSRPPDEFESGDLNTLVRDLMRRVSDTQVCEGISRSTSRT